MRRTRLGTVTHCFFVYTSRVRKPEAVVTRARGDNW